MISPFGPPDYGARRRQSRCHTPAMTSVTAAVPGRRVVVGAYAVLFVGAFATAFYLIDPVHVGRVGFDAAASVLYFDRLVQGRHLESFISATPKPLLTVVYGVLYKLTGDWRPISWLVIALFGLSAVLAASLALRFGGIPAAAFAGAAVISSPALIEDVGLAYAVVWAFVGCLLAGLAVSADRPRYGWAGIALGVSALARFEVVLILGACVVVLVGAWVWARYRHVRGPDRRAWLLLVGIAAIPVQFSHDWLLTGNALYAEHVPVVASVGLALGGPLRTIAYIAYHLIGMGPLLVLATVGASVLFRRRAWGILVGLAAMGPGVAAFLVFLSIRRIYVSSRYLDPIELAVIVAAAIGFGAITIRDVPDATRRITGRTARSVMLILGVGLIAVVLSAPFALINKTVFQTLASNRAIQRDASEALPTLRTAIAAIPGQQPAVLVPSLLRPQFIVELGLPTTQVSGTTAAALGTDGTYPLAGQVIYHDRSSEPGSAFAFLEVSQPTIVGRIVVTPLLADPTRGVWVDRINSAP